MKKLFSLITILCLISATRAQTALNDSAKSDLQKTNTEFIKFYQQKKYDEALPLAQKSIQQTEQIFGKDSLETARAIRNLGFTHYAKNDTKAAENVFEKALGVYKKSPNLDKQNGANLAEMIETLALIKYQKRMDSAESLFESALTWREKIDGADSIKVLNSLSALANINYWRKDYKKASTFFGRLLEISAKNQQISAADISLAYYRTECSYRKAGTEKDFEPLKERYQSQIKLKEKESLQKSDDAEAGRLINGGVINGKALNLPNPGYPIEARRASAEGKVEVQVMINEEGNVIHACAVTSNHPALIEAAEISAYQAKFKQTSLEGKSVRVFGIILYNFIK